MNPLIAEPSLLPNIEIQKQLIKNKDNSLISKRHHFEHVIQRALTKLNLEMNRRWLLDEPEEAFGYLQWRINFGKINHPISLPRNIEKILQSPCPIWLGKRIAETHTLVFVPDTLNGEPLTIKKMVKFCKRSLPKFFKTASDLQNLTAERAKVVKNYRHQEVSKAHWVLMTNDVIPESKDQSYEQQKVLMTQLSKKANRKYKIPHLLDLCVCIFAKYISSSNYLFSQTPNVFTHCRERFQDWRVVVGHFDVEDHNFQFLFNNPPYNSPYVGAVAMHKLK